MTSRKTHGPAALSQKAVKENGRKLRKLRYAVSAWQLDCVMTCADCSSGCFETGSGATDLPFGSLHGSYHFEPRVSQCRNAGT